jgi:sugar phosphate isomerase/epimerase
MLSMTTDYAKSTGNPEPYLRRIAEAGFSHIHWCHHWNTDFLYSTHEMAQIARWLAEYGLQLLDLHASQGREKNWGSSQEYARLAGIELVKNRISMAAELASDVIILHLPDGSKSRVTSKSPSLAQVRRSLDELIPFAQARGVRIALENLSDKNFEKIKQLCTEYGADGLWKSPCEMPGSRLKPSFLPGHSKPEPRLPT